LPCSETCTTETTSNRAANIDCALIPFVKLEAPEHWQLGSYSGHSLLATQHYTHLNCSLIVTCLGCTRCSERYVRWWRWPVTQAAPLDHRKRALLHGRANSVVATSNSCNNSTPRVIFCLCFVTFDSANIVMSSHRFDRDVYSMTPRMKHHRQSVQAQYAKCGESSRIATGRWGE
jgi:hypothetical protein